MKQKRRSIYRWTWGQKIYVGFLILGTLALIVLGILIIQEIHKQATEPKPKPVPKVEDGIQLLSC